VQKLKRSIQTFIQTKQALKSEASKDKAKYALANFTKFTKKYYQKSVDELVEEITDTEIAYDILQAWLNYMGKSFNPRTTINYFSVIRQYLHYKGVKFHPLDIKQNLVFPKLVEDEKYGLTSEDIKQILDSVPYRKKMLYLTQISSGMRIGEIVRLRKKHFDLTKERVMIRIPAELDKNRRERITFCSKEAGKLLKPILVRKENEDLIFTKNSQWRQAKATEMKYLSKVVDNLFPDNRYSTGIRKITTRSFRAYFITKISRIDPNLAKRFAGQKGYLLQYDRLSEREKLDIYLQMEPELLIDDREKLKTRNERLEKEKKVVENQRIENEKMLKRIENLEFGSPARTSEHITKMLQLEDDPSKRIMESILFFWFEMRATEDEKRKNLEEI